MRRAIDSSGLRMASGKGNHNDEVALSGSLKSMSLSDLLQWISYGRKSGRLLLEHGSLRKTILFREGRVYTSSSNNPRESLGHYLVSMKQISEQQLFKALLLQHKHKKPLGEVLVEEGASSIEEVGRVIEHKTREAIFDMFEWSEGKFQFYEEDIADELRISLSIEVSGLVLEGIKRIDDWTRIREVIPSNATTFKVRSHQGGGLEERDALALTLAGNGRTVGRIADEMKLSEFEVSELLYRLMTDGRIAVDSTGEVPKPGETVRKIKSLVKRGDQHFKDGRYSESKRTFAEVLKLDPLNQYAKVYTLKIMNMAAKLKAGESIPRNGIPMVRPDTESKDVVFSPQEIQILARIDGQRDVEAVLTGSPLPEEETLMVLKRFLDLNVVGFR